MKRIPVVLFFMVAAWLILVGIADISINKTDDLPWIAEMVGNGDVSKFDAPLDILTSWIGMLLIVTGLTLVVLGTNVLSSRSCFFGAALLSIGVSVAQLVTLNAVGLPVAFLIGPSVAAFVSIVASGLSWRWREQ